MPPFLLCLCAATAGGKADQGAGLGVHVERAPGLRADLSLQPGHGAARRSPRQTAQAQQGTLGIPAGHGTALLGRNRGKMSACGNRSLTGCV